MEGGVMAVHGAVSTTLLGFVLTATESAPTYLATGELRLAGPHCFASLIRCAGLLTGAHWGSTPHLVARFHLGPRASEELKESGNDGYPRVGGGSVSGRSSSSGSAVGDGRDTALGKTDARSESPPEERTLGVSRGFFFGSGAS
jgi:hypothetical protein